MSYRVAGGCQAAMDTSTGETRLFDLQKDPRRERDVSHLHPSLARELAAGSPADSPVPPDAGALERLRGLDYIDE